MSTIVNGVGKERRSRINSGDVFALLSSRPETNPSRIKHGSESGIEVSEWIREQEVTFTNWINGHLKSSEHQTSISDLRDGLKDGLVLIELMKTLAPHSIQFIRYHKSPRLRLLKLENVQIALNSMKREGVPLLNIEPADIVDGNLKLTLGLLQQLANHFPLHTESHKGSSSKSMLAWFQALLPDCNIENFTTSWSDGILLSLLVNKLCPGLIDNVTSLDPKDSLQNIQQAMAAANNEFQIPQVISPKDMASNNREAIINYLSYFCGPDSPGYQYMLDWINRTIPGHSIINFTSDWLDGLALSSLVNTFLPGTIAVEEEEEIKEGSPIDRVTYVMKAAEQELSINQLVKSEEFVSKDTEELFRMAYLMQFFHLSVNTVSSPSNEQINPIYQSTSSDDVTGVPVAPAVNEFSFPLEFAEETKLPAKITTDFVGNLLDDDPPGDHESSRNLVEKEQPEKFELEVHFRLPPKEEYSREEMDIKWDDSGRKLREKRRSQLDELVAAAELDFDLVLKEIDEMGTAESPRGRVSSQVVQSKDLEMDFDFSSDDGSTSSSSRSKSQSPVLPAIQEVVDDKEQAREKNVVHSLLEERESTANVEVKKIQDGTKMTADREATTDKRLTEVEEMNHSHPSQEKEEEQVTASEEERDRNREVSVESTKDSVDEEIIEVAYVSNLHSAHSPTSSPEPRSVYSSTNSPTPGLSHSPSLPPEAPVKDATPTTPLTLPDLCIVDDSELKFGIVNQPVSFTVDCSNSGRGRLEVIIEDPNGENLEADGRQLRSNVFQLNFIPVLVGTHKIAVLFGDRDVPHSPFICQVSDPLACTVSGPGLDSNVITIGREMTFQVDTSKAGPGTLQATFTGAKQPSEFQLVSCLEGVCTYRYKATQPGKYSIDVTWVGRHVSGSPFHIMVPDPVPFRPDNCIVLDQPVGRVQMGEEIRLKVDASRAGYGELKALMVTPNSEHICNISVDTRKVYTVSAWPNAVGKHSVILQYGGEEIPQSPLLIYVNNPKLIQTDLSSLTSQPLMINEAITLHVNVGDCGEGILAVRIQTPTGSTDHARVHCREQHDRVVTYVPRIEGQYNMEMFYDNSPCLSEPIKLEVQRPRTVEDITLTKSLPVRGHAYHVNKMVEFYVDAPNRDPTLLEMSAKPLNRQGNSGDDLKLYTNIVINGEDKYSLQLRASKSDDYEVSVLYDGLHLNGSPFVVPIRSPPRPSKVAMFDPVIPLKSTQPLELVFDTSQAGEGSLTAYALNSKNKNMAVHVEQINSGMYRLSFIPQSSDTFMVTVLYADKHINGSPFRVLYKEQTKSPSVGVYFEPEMEAKGLMGAAVYGRNSGRQEATVIQYERERYQVSFCPSQADVFDLHVYWFDQEIEGSPFEIDLLGMDNESSESLVDSVPYTADGKVGMLAATAVGRSTGPVPVHLTASEDDGSCNVEFATSSSDSFDVNLFWNGKPLKGMPVNVQI